MYYGKLTSKRGQTERDTLTVTHSVKIKGNRQYLTTVSTEHDDYPPQKKTTRMHFSVQSNYFEPTADGKGVKNILIVQMQPGMHGNESSVTRSFSKEGLN